MNTTLDVTGLQGWIGRQEALDDVVTPELVRRFNATFDAGSATPAEGEVAPRLIHFCLAQPAVTASELGEDGHPRRGGFLPPIPLPRRMWAGGALSFPGEIRVGESVTRRSRIADVQVKSGRTGELCFVTVDHQIEASRRIAVEERQTIVYRGSAGVAAPVETPATDHGVSPKAVVQAPPTLLFRYSALTFNGHRIHYDRPYAVEAEHYPGLVVHGPLQATLLIRLAADLKGGVPPARFEFRSVSPLFDTAPVHLFAQETSEASFRLWTSRPNGPQAMVADAHWNDR